MTIWLLLLGLLCASGIYQSRMVLDPDMTMEEEQLDDPSNPILYDLLDSKSISTKSISIYEYAINYL